MADLYDLREIVTGKFYERHIVVTRDVILNDLDEIAKKAAELLYQTRGVAISTIVVLGRREALALKAEVKGKQAHYERDPHQQFVTDQSFPLFERGTKAGAPAAKKRASYVGLCRFRYGVLPVEGEHGPRFKIDHYDGVV